MTNYAGPMPKKTIKEKVSEDIFNDVVYGNYPPGAILSEGMLTEKYQVSKSPIREALVTLCNDGVLMNIPRVGYQVVPITPQQFREMEELRIIVEESALRKTLETITCEGIQELEQNICDSEYLNDEKDILQHWTHNMGFHLLLCKQCGNQYIYKSLEGILRFFSRAAFQYFTNSWERGKRTDAAAHKRILQAIKMRDVETAVSELKADIGCMYHEVLY